MFWFVLHYILLDLSRISKPETPKKRLKGRTELIEKLCVFIQPSYDLVFVSRKIGQDLQQCETKPQLVNQKCVVCQLQSWCNLCDTGSYVGYARGHLYARVNSHRTSSSVRKHYDNDHACNVPEDPLSYFKVQLKKKMQEQISTVL